MLKHILFIEDEPDIRLIVMASLQHFGGYEVMACSCGEDALEKATGFKADLILLDVMMPVMDGPTTLAKLRQLSHYSKLPAVFMTAKIQANEVAELLSCGATEVIAKPFDPLLLSAKLKKIYEDYHINKL